MEPWRGSLWVRHLGGNCPAGGPPLVPRPAQQVQNASISLVDVAFHLKGGGLVVLYKLGPGGLFSQLGSDLVAGLDLAIMY